ncbi:hypothetical protein [Phenylobacterium sp.]|jgi:hypothetical protein|uniref:hypothetical protein n=1 Tax=Phenylobacterium sp. TaxID=1871053 RepID=UPI002E317A3F|nr:hypothetical protein [Phenylobacterium sp.]HEX2561627.1 hypothetical protein [Phenylobacterium sp.]
MAWNNPLRRRASADGVVSDPAPLTGDDMRAAYKEGRRDARRQRKRHPLGMTLLFAAAAVGLGVIAYATFEGSFGRGGERLDSDLAVAADNAEPVVRDAAQQAGAQLKESMSGGEPKTTP